MKKHEIKEGMKFYDEVNDRYITVTKVDHFSNCVTTKVTETTYDEDGNETGETTDTVLFTREEICGMTPRD